jgi:hypothetical protein
VDDVAEVEGVLLLGHAGVEHHLKQQIAQLLAQIGEVAAGDRVGHFVGLFQRIGSNGRKILLEIPRAAAARRSQRRHDVEQT